MNSLNATERDARDVTKPIRGLVDATERVTARTGKQDNPRTTSDESGPLTECFNSMRRCLDDVEQILLKQALELEHEVRERRRVEEALRQSHAELERSNADLEQFAYMASHDLQEPLRAVSGFAELLKKQYEGQLDERADEYIYFLVDGAKRMQTLVRNLLDYSRVGTHGKVFERGDTREIIDAALRNLRTAIEEAGAEIHIRETPTVVGDKAQLVRLFQNLLGNAIKFRGPEKPRIDIHAVKAEGEWVFCIRDNGIGIQPEHTKRIFVIFQRLHARDKYPGTGIGLAICQRIVQRHGGRIWVESKPGQGSAFYFTLPG